jgi:hypothetical protein
MGSPLVIYTLDDVAGLLKVSRDIVDAVSLRYPFLFKQIEHHVRTSRDELHEIGLAVGAHEQEPGREALVYVIGYGPYVKIGMTRHLRSRLSSLQTSSPEQIVTYGLLDGADLLENWLHERGATLRLNGEWFRKEGELDEWIKTGCQL